MGLIEAVGPGPVGLDTCVFIYLFEADHRYVEVLRPAFEAIDAGRVEAATSLLTLLEVLVVPLRAGDVDLASRYESILSRSRVRLVELDRPVVLGAAQLRARHGLKTPDALQLAAAARAGCTTFLTNDRRLPDLPGLRVLQLSDHLAP